MPLRTIGTTPVNVLNDNAKRKRLMIQYQPAGVDANNTGIIFMGFGSIPGTTVGAPNQGETLRPAAALDEPYEGRLIDQKYKKAVWLVSDTASQTVWVEEESEEIPG